MVELKGSLGGIGLPALVQLLGELHETGRLELWSGNWQAHLGFETGRLVDASFGHERGLDALAACMLTLADADFVFVEGTPPAERTIDLAPEALRAHLGELSSRGAPHVIIPSLEAVPRLLPNPEVRPSEHVVLDRGAVQILLLVDGQRSVREIVGSRPLVPALRELAMLADQGLIALEAPAAPAARPSLPAVPVARPRVAAVPPSGEPAPVAEPLLVDGVAVGACPKLGFADDPTRHYSRATALHRCYATGQAGLVTGPEQRDLCLSGRYAACPRFRAASIAAPVAASAPAGRPSPEPPAAASTSATGHPSASAVPGAVESPARARPPVPAGVAARMAAAVGGMRLADAEAATGEPAPPKSAGRPPGRPRRGRLLGRLRLVLTILLLGILAVAALAGLASFFGPTGSPAAAPATSVPFTPSAARRSVPPSVPTNVEDTSNAAPAGAAGPTSTAARAVVEVAAVSASPVPRASTPTTSPGLPTPTPLASGRVLADTRFAGGPQPSWVDNPPFASWSDGAYRLRAREATHFVAVGAPIDDVPDDVIVSATFRKTGGPPGGGYGLLLRDRGPEPRDGQNQTMNAYVVEAGDLGEYGVWRRDGDHWVDLVPWARGASVRPGGSPNELSVRMSGGHLTFVVNGVQVAAVDDDTLPSGGVGVFAGGDFNEVAVDRFTLQVPD